MASSGGWIRYSKRDDRVDMRNVVYKHVGFLGWLAVATTALSFVLVRRSARVQALLEARRRLVSESARADEVRNAELAEHLHDGPLQTLLAARLALDEIRERNPDPALDRVCDALQQTATGLRSAVTELHPQVLAQLGLVPALRELVRQFESRNNVTVVANLDDVGHPDSRSLLYRAARELLSNVSKHAKAKTVTVGLRRDGDRTVLTVADDGVGFDSSTVAPSPARGHIGLASLRVRIETAGGTMDVSSKPGVGTRVTVTL